MSTVKVIGDSDFDTSVLEVDGSVLVYFWAPWCGPCRLMSPMVESLASEYGDRLQVVKMEVDPNPDSVARCNVQGVPALVLFQQGKPVETLEGVVNKQRLEGALTQHL